MRTLRVYNTAGELLTLTQRPDGCVLGNAGVFTNRQCEEIALFLLQVTHDARRLAEASERPAELAAARDYLEAVGRRCCD